MTGSLIVAIVAIVISLGSLTVAVVAVRIARAAHALNARRDREERERREAEQFSQAKRVEPTAFESGGHTVELTNRSDGAITDVRLVAAHCPDRPDISVRPSASPAHNGQPTRWPILEAGAPPVIFHFELSKNRERVSPVKIRVQGVFAFTDRHGQRWRRDGNADPVRIAATDDQ